MHIPKSKAFGAPTLFGLMHTTTMIDVTAKLALDATPEDRKMHKEHLEQYRATLVEQVRGFLKSQGLN